MSTQQPDNSGSSPQMGANWLLFVVHAWAVSIEVFLHRGIGERYVGAQGAAVLLLVPVYCLGWEGYDLAPMMYFLAAYLVMCLLARLEVIARRRRGEYGHSQYTGRPLIMRLFPGWDEVKVKANTEPLLVVIIGCLTFALSPPLCFYLIIAAICLAAKTNGEAVLEHQFTLDLNDAVIEQEVRAERFRDIHRNR